MNFLDDKIKSNIHEFSFFAPFVENIVKYKSNIDSHEINDIELAHRLGNVLRLEKGNLVTFFDTNFYIKTTILNINPKKSISFEVLNIEKNQILEPNITWILPILKREAFEEALYSLTALGVQKIQPIYSQKTQKLIANEKDQTRYKKIIISAAEQSKQFILPQLFPAIPFEIYTKQINIKNDNQKIFFDYNGESFFPIISHLKQEKTKDLIIISGPEGDFTNNEKNILSQLDFKFCALTKTILRAEQAVSIGCGIIRSLL